MSKDVSLTSILIYGLYLISFCECSRKNVCKTFEDYRTIENNPNCWYNPDVGATPGKIVKRYGYPFESYKITTDDGYIVSLFRIPHNGNDINRKRPPVFFQHGIAVDSSTWLSLGIESVGNSLMIVADIFLVFTFVNDGYDVWMANSRGTKFSSKHTKYTVYEPQYWDFSFHELAMYDVPAMLDFIATKTGQKIIYIGHSMGTSMSYVYASLKPEHAASHLKTIVSLAPIAYLDHINPLAKIVLPFRNHIWKFLTSLGLYGIGPNIQFKLDIIHYLCSHYPFIVACAMINSVVAGLNENELQVQVLPVTFSNYPSGLSIKTLVHYAQIADAKQRFQFFDYGTEGNLRVYNSRIPPEYPLSQIKVPVHLLYGKRDTLSREQDVIFLYNKLETNKTIMEIYNFGHNDYFIAKHSADFAKILLKLLKNY